MKILATRAWSRITTRAADLRRRIGRVTKASSQRECTNFLRHPGSNATRIRSRHRPIGRRAMVALRAGADDFIAVSSGLHSRQVKQTDEPLWQPARGSDFVTTPFAAAHILLDRHAGFWPTVDSAYDLDNAWISFQFVQHARDRGQSGARERLGQIFLQPWARRARFTVRIGRPAGTSNSPVRPRGFTQYRVPDARSSDPKCTWLPIRK